MSQIPRPEMIEDSMAGQVSFVRVDTAQDQGSAGHGIMLTQGRGLGTRGQNWVRNMEHLTIA